MADSLGAVSRDLHREAPARRLADGVVSKTHRSVPTETAVALVFDGGTEAVMMATPADLEDFAVGFAITEGIVASPSQIASLEIVDQPGGVEARLWLSVDRGGALSRRRRVRIGPTGCGLCGIDSLAEAVRPLPKLVSTLTVAASEIIAAMQSLGEAQDLNRATHAVHAAGLLIPGEGIMIVREDVGRHNALDKLAGAAARSGRLASEGVVLLTSRVSVELVQKAAMIGAPILAAVSAPTALALDTAETTGITIVGVVRRDGLEAFTHLQRLRFDAPAARSGQDS